MSQALLAQFRLKTDLDEQLKKLFWVEIIYGSSVVEGVNLQKSEVKEIVEFGSKSKLLKGKPRIELLQALGQKLALVKIEKWAKTKDPVTIESLQKIHYLIFSKIDQSAGKFREHHIRLLRTPLMPSLPVVMALELRDFNDWLLRTQKTLNKNKLEEILNLIAQCYHQITRIHPFSDGNGRVSRLMINLILRKYLLPYILVPKVDNEEGMRRVLREADMGDIKPLVGFMGKLLKRSLKQALRNS